jgi:hypothetical protein
LKILPGTRFKDPKAAIITQKIFTAANQRSALENIDQSQRRTFLGGFQKAFSKLFSNFKEANKNFKIVLSIENIFKTLTVRMWIGQNTEIE